MKVAGAALGTAAAGMLLAACKPSPTEQLAPTGEPTPVATVSPVTPLPALTASTMNWVDPDQRL